MMEIVWVIYGFHARNYGFYFSFERMEDKVKKHGL
jgi:hypothetical protein